MKEKSKCNRFYGRNKSTDYRSITAVRVYIRNKTLQNCSKTAGRRRKIKLVHGPLFRVEKKLFHHFATEREKPWIRACGLPRGYRAVAAVFVTVSDVIIINNLIII